MRLDRAVVVGVLIAVVALGTEYALRTPAWQAPDEPAHYNFARQLAASPGDLPEIQQGDYPHETIQELTRRRFPTEMPVDELEYEDYQPPLYYLLAAAALRAARVDGDRLGLLAVRWLGVCLGALTVALVYQVARAVDPADGALAAAAAGIAAFIPMRLAVTSAANNDALAILVAASATLLATWRASDRVADRRFLVLGSALTAVALLTKASVYPCILLLAAAEVIRLRAPGREVVVARREIPQAHGATQRRLPPAGEAARAALRLGALAVVGVAVAGPWFARNVAVYGALDILGTQAHNRVVVGQPRTSAWIAEHGVGGLARRFATFTFDSFWGVFGWMSVFMEQRVYAALAVFSACAISGFLLYARDLRQRGPGAYRETAAVTVLAVAMSLSVALYVAYNVTFVQHQGRYLFTALAAIAVFLALGVRQLARSSAALPRLTGHGQLLERLVLYGVVAALLALSWTALDRYVVPGLQ